MFIILYILIALLTCIIGSRVIELLFPHSQMTRVLLQIMLWLVFVIFPTTL